MKLFSTIALMIALATPVAAQAEFCEAVGKVISPVVDARDKGLSPKVAKVVIEGEFNEKVANAVVLYVYGYSYNKDKESILKTFMDSCLEGDF